MADPREQLLGAAALSVAVIAAVVVVGGYLLLGDPDPATAPSPSRAAEEVPFGGTPIPELPGMPTPIGGTGMLDAHRPEVGEPAPGFALADVRDPSRIRQLEEFAGTPTVLNWYADWCEPCKEELPAFQSAQDALGDDVTFLAINFLQDQETALAVLEDLGITFPAVMDTNGAISDHCRIGSHLPVTMTIDADGIVRRIHVGPLLGEDLEEALAEIGLEYEAG